VHFGGKLSVYDLFRSSLSVNSERFDYIRTQSAPEPAYPEKNWGIITYIAQPFRAILSALSNKGWPTSDPAVTLRAPFSGHDILFI
jgi:hypothetical protein